MTTEGAVTARSAPTKQYKNGPSPCPFPRKRGEGARLLQRARPSRNKAGNCRCSPSPRLREEGWGEGQAWAHACALRTKRSNLLYHHPGPPPYLSRPINPTTLPPA